MKNKLLLIGIGAAMTLTACGTTAVENDSAPEEAAVVTETEDLETEVESSETSEAMGTEEDDPNAEVLVIQAETPLAYNGKDLLITMPEEEGAVTLSYGEESIQITDFAVFLPDSYLIPEDDGSFYAAVVTGDYNDWEITRMVCYQPESGFTIGEEVSGGINDISDISPAGAVLCSSVDCFGTYPSRADYTIDGINLQRQGTYYDFNNVPDEEIAAEWQDSKDDPSWNQIYAEDGRRILTLKQNMNALSEDGTEITISAGDVIYPAGADLEDQIFYFLYNDSLCHVSYDQDEDESWNRNVDGADEFDLFEFVPYAG